MKKMFSLLLVMGLFLSAVFSACSPGSAAEPEPTPEATATAEPTVTPAATGTPAPTATPKPTPTATPEPAEEPTEEPTQEPTQKPVTVPAAVPTAAPTAAPTSKPDSQPTAPPATPKPAGCSHNWKAETKTVHHDEVTTQKWVVDKPASQKVVSYYVCNTCGYRETSLSGSFADHIYSHDPAPGYHVVDETITTPEEGHYETVVTPGWDETVTTGYVCTLCGAHKSA